jgi:ParB family chromosome partitioning protein
LGKGLNALIPLDDESSSLPAQGAPEKTILTGEGSLPLEMLRTNPNQPRKHFDEESLQELADSIREHGIIQPIIAEDAGDGTYTIVAGERRIRAAALAGLVEVPVLIRNYTDEKRMEISLIENIQRTDLNPIEEAGAYKRLMELTGFSQDEVAAKVGKKRSTVANTLRLLKLPPAMQECLKIGQISSGHARALLSVTDTTHQEQLFQKMLSTGISVREAEKCAAAYNDDDKEVCPQTEVDPKTKAVPKRDPELIAMQEKFIESLGTKVTIEGDFHKGSIRIDYYSMKDLDRLYELLGK